MKMIIMSNLKSVWVKLDHDPKNPQNQTFVDGGGSSRPLAVFWETRCAQWKLYDTLEAVSAWGWILVRDRKNLLPPKFTFTSPLMPTSTSEHIKSIATVINEFFFSFIKVRCEFTWMECWWINFSLSIVGVCYCQCGCKNKYIQEEVRDIRSSIPDSLMSVWMMQFHLKNVMWPRALYSPSFS